MPRLTAAFNRAAGSEPREMDLFLMRAIIKDDNTIARDMIDNGADVNYRNKKGETPLMAAAYKGNAEIMKHLLEQGCDVNAVDEQGNTAMHWLVKSEWTRQTPDMAQLLIDSGVNTHIKNTSGETAEFLAGEFRKDRLARLMRAGQKEKEKETIEVVKPIRLKTAPKPAEAEAAPEPAPEPEPAPVAVAPPPAPKVEKTETIREMEKRFSKAGLFG